MGGWRHHCNCCDGAQYPRHARLGEWQMTRLLIRLSPWNWIPYAIIFAWVGWWAYDQFVPVVRMQGEVFLRTEDSVVLHMYGSKVRECRFVGIQGFSSVHGGMNRDMHIKRIDMPSEGKTKPIGVFDIGHWQLHPLAGATNVTVWVQHSCREGDLRNTKIAEVAL
jgi:hypothetical protein